MTRKACLWAAFVFWFFVSSAPAAFNLLNKAIALQTLNRRLQGQVVDHTHNHGRDRRIWSPALGQCRDLYVYLPPGFNPDQSYPFMMWLHGFAQDEISFLQYVVKPLDEAIACGKLPPLIVAAPDGSITGKASWTSAGSFFVNTRAGAFEDRSYHARKAGVECLGLRHAELPDPSRARGSCPGGGLHGRRRRL